MFQVQHRLLFAPFDHLYSLPRVRLLLEYNSPHQNLLFSPQLAVKSPEVLREALSAALQSRPGRARTLMIAVTLLDGINDRPDDARKLAEFLKPLFEHVKKIAVDLIPYNPHEGTWSKSFTTEQGLAARQGISSLPNGGSLVTI